jgi:peptidyl-prolyl cis-trans isomerase D
MLTALRDLLRTKLAALLVGLLIVSLAVWGISDIFRGGLGESIAKAGEQRLLTRTFDRRVRNFLNAETQERGAVVTRRDIAESGELDRLFRSELGQLVQLGYADKVGAIASDGALAADAAAIPAFQDPATGAFSTEAYLRRLQNANIVVADYERDTRERLSLDYLRQGLGAAISVPDTIARPTFDLLTETRDIEYLRLPEAFIPEPEPASEADLAAFYESNKGGLEVPERRAISVLSFTAADFVAAVEVSREEIAEAYEALKSRQFTAPSKLQLNYLIYASRADANAALARLNVGTALDELGDALQPIDSFAAVFAEADMTSETISADVFGPLSEQGAVFGPYESGEAFQLVMIDEIIAGDVQPLEEVRDIVRQRLAEELAGDAYIEAADEATRLLGGGFSLEEIADAVGAPVMSFAPVTANGATAESRRLNGIVQVPDGLEIAQELIEGEISNPIETGAEYYALVRVDRVLPPYTPTLDDVREDLTTVLANQRRSDAARLFADDIDARLKAGETTLQAEADAAGSVVTTLQDVDRRAPPSELSPMVLTQAFDVREDSVFAMPSAFGGVTLVSVSDIRKQGGAGDTSIAEVRAALAETVTNDVLNAAYMQLGDAVELDVDDASYAAFKADAAGNQ